ERLELRLPPERRRPARQLVHWPARLAQGLPDPCFRAELRPVPTPRYRACPCLFRDGRREEPPEQPLSQQQPFRWRPSPQRPSQQQASPPPHSPQQASRLPPFRQRPFSPRASRLRPVLRPPSRQHATQRLLFRPPP